MKDLITQTDFVIPRKIINELIFVCEIAPLDHQLSRVTVKLLKRQINILEGKLEELNG